MPPIRGFIENTLLDWEGKLAAVVFLPGCNFRCGYCHARHLIETAPSDETIPLEAVLLSLRRQRGWIDGVVISGGEPSLHPDLLDLILALREEDVSVKLDTNGSRPGVLEDLFRRGVLDYVAMDIKAPLDGKYAEVTGARVDLNAIRRSIDLVMCSGVPYEFRTTVCPTTLSNDDIEEIGKVITGARLYYLQTFRPVNTLDRSLESVKPCNPDEMRDLCRLASPYVQRCAVRGDTASEFAVAGVTS